jgi:hypothetical protein
MGAINTTCKVDSTAREADNAWHDADVLLDFSDNTERPPSQQVRSTDFSHMVQERDLRGDGSAPIKRCPFSKMAQEGGSGLKKCPFAEMAAGGSSEFTNFSFSAMAQENGFASKELPETEIEEALLQDQLPLERPTLASRKAQVHKQDSKKKSTASNIVSPMRGEPSEKHPKEDVHSDSSAKATAHVSQNRVSRSAESSTRRNSKRGSRRKSNQAKPVPFVVTSGHYEATESTEELFESIGGMKRLVSLMSRFYGKMFMDAQLSKFVVDETDPHAKRLALWVAEKMTGDPLWSSDLSTRSSGQPRTRVQAHSKAWNCSKRGERIGEKFKLDDTVIWMRLMFWSCREEGLDVEPFFSWYIEFIRHFIRIYEKGASSVAWSCAEWSANPTNISEYQKDGLQTRKMADVVALRPKSITRVEGSNFE